MSCVFSVMGSMYSFTPASANENSWLQIQIYALLLHSCKTCCMNKTTLGFALSIAFIMCIYFSVWCLHVPAHKWFFACGIEWLPHVPWLCCLFGHCRICSWIISTYGFLSLQLTQKIFADSDCLLGLPNSPAAVVLLNQACVIHHMLSWAVRSNHEKCCFSLYETTMLASNFKPPLSSCALHLHNLFCGHAAP